MAWAAEPDGVRVVASPGAPPRKLPYPEAALWDFLARGVGEDRILAMMKHIGGFADETATAAFVTACLDRWAGQGLIVRD